MSEPRINLDEWRREVERVFGSAGEEGLTLAELSEVLGISRERMRQRLVLLHRAGRLITTRKPGMDIAGRRTRVPCYRLLKASGGPPAPRTRG